MEKGPIWIVRAGEGAAYVEEFLQEGLVAIAWKEPGPLEPDVSDDEIEQRFAEAYVQEKEG
jgi:restriction system protein